MGIVFGCILAVCLVLFLLHPLLSVGFATGCFLIWFSYKLLGLCNFIVVCMGLFALWCIRNFNPQYKEASKQVKERKQELNATLFRLYHPDEYFELEQQNQPKMSAETKARVRRIQKQLKEQQAKRVANSMPIAKDLLSRHKKR